MVIMLGVERMLVFAVEANACKRAPNSILSPLLLPPPKVIPFASAVVAAAVGFAIAAAIVLRLLPTFSKLIRVTSGQWRPWRRRVMPPRKAPNLAVNRDR